MAVPTPQEILNGMLYASTKWSGPAITYSIPGPASTWPGYPDLGPEWSEYWGNEPRRPGFGFLTDAQADVFRGFVAAYARLVAVPIVESDDLLRPGDIRIAFVDTSPWGGYATLPPEIGSSGEPRSGDIWLHSDWSKRSLEVGWDFQKGQSPSPGVLHELGHALGLRHPFEEPTSIPVEFQTERHTVMAYESPDRIETLSFSNYGGTLLTRGERVVIDTPMVYDILAVQTLYGANPTTAAAADVYTFDESKPFIEAIYDAAGHDRIDLSAHTRASYIDLTPGAYSSIAIHSREAQQVYWVSRLPQFAEQIAATLERSENGGLLYTGRDNLGIAFSTIIEDVAAGKGADTVIGNSVANSLSGNAGVDRILAGGGNDTILGGAGDDFLRGEEGDDSLSGGDGFDDMHGNMGADTLYGGSGDDWVVGGQHDDLLHGQAGNDLIYGNMGRDLLDGREGADTLLGGQDNDSLAGGGGADFLSGDRGDDTIMGGVGADTFYSFAGAGIDRVLDFNRAEGDRVAIGGGTAYAVTSDGGDVFIAFDGGQIILVGWSVADLTGDWIISI
jgi:serralysin